MKGIANSLLAILIVSVLLMSLTNCIMFFPWYMALVYETFNLSVRAANVNCITEEMIQDVQSGLENKPLFRECKQDLKVYYNGFEVLSGTAPSQRGITFNVGIGGRFPFILNIFGKEYRFTTPVSLHIPTTGTRYYKELP